MAIDLANALVSFVIGSVGAGLTGAYINKRFTTALDIWRSQRGWREQTVTELLGPVSMQFDRTKRAFDRWDKKNLFLEAEIIRKGNLAIRDLLLSRSHLIPPELRPDASELVLHYDVWLEEFERVRNSGAAEQANFTFAGTLGYPFPTGADDKFRNAFRTNWEALYAGER